MKIADEIGHRIDTFMKMPALCGQLAARRKFFANVVLRSLIAGWDRFVDINPESTVFDIVFFLLNFGDQIGRQF